MNLFIGTKVVHGTPMNREEYAAYRGWELPKDENGEDTGYLVEYTDENSVPNHPKHKGYISWSPSEVFEGSYKNMQENLCFATALNLLKKGYRVARKGWNGKGMRIVLNPGSNGSIVTMNEDSIYAKKGVESSEILPHIDMYTINAEGRRAMLPGWLASQSDLLCEDWTVVLDPATV